jgi:hypothetical protein
VPSSRRKPQKVLQKLGARFRTFFGMKLYGENILFFDDSRKIRTVLAESDSFAIRVRRCERMRKIKIGVGRNPL